MEMEVCGKRSLSLKEKTILNYFISVFSPKNLLIIIIITIKTLECLLIKKKPIVFNPYKKVYY